MPGLESCQPRRRALTSGRHGYAGPAEGQQGGDGDGDRPAVAYLIGAGLNGRPGINRVIGDGHPPPADPASHVGKAVPSRLSWPRGRNTMSGQEGRFQKVGDSLGQERASLHGPAYRVDPVL